MNTMIYYSINILILSVLVLIVGMIKPKWIFLWMEKPGRMEVAMIASVIFMIAAVMFGEGNKQMQQEKAQKETQQQTAQPANDAAVPTTPAAPAGISK